MIRHHPGEATLLTCAAGTLPEPHARVVAAHAMLCSVCARALQQAEAIGGAILADLPPSPLADDALTRTLDRLHMAPPSEPESVSLTLAGLAVGRWRWTGPGVAMMPLRGRDATGSRLDLVRVAPGVALLEHGHTGRESTCVLQGAFHDGIGEYRAGDFMEAGGDVAHQPKAMAGDTCICLIATSGHLRPRSLLGYLARLVLGM